MDMFWQAKQGGRVCGKNVGKQGKRTRHKKKTKNEKNKAEKAGGLQKETLRGRGNEGV